MRRTVPFAFVVAALAGAPPAHAQGPPIDGPALGPNRITQVQITSGLLGIKAIRRKGAEIFATPFNQFDGHGDGPLIAGEDPTKPGGRPTIQGNMLRVNGLDTQSCNECHSVLSNRLIPGTFTVGGVGGNSASAFPDITAFDIADADGNGIADINGRAINPPFVFGSGGVELVGKEMTIDLQAIKELAKANPDVVYQLVTKGVDFGTIFFDSESQEFDTSGVEGVDPDLVVQPFGRKGNNSTIREFDIGALKFHQGMQPVEDVGANNDADQDGVVDEILIGELSALHLFSTSSDRPIRVAKDDPNVAKGEKLFGEIGCEVCHVPIMNTNTTLLPVAFPEVETDPYANVFFYVDLVNGRAGFEPNLIGGVSVNMYSDLKRHDMGDELAETSDEQTVTQNRQFITARLWGVADTAPYMHDGRAFTIRQAIEQHGGTNSESAFAALQFAALSDKDQECVLIFLNSLRVPKDPNGDILRSALSTAGP